MVDINVQNMVKGLHSDDPIIKTRTMEEVRTMLMDGLGDTSLLPPMLELIDDDDIEVRRLATWCLGKLAMMKIGDRRSVKNLVRLMWDEDAEIRENAVWTVGELAGMNIGETYAIDVLNDLLSDPEAEIRGMAAWALGRMALKMRVASPSSVRLLKRLTTEESQYVRKGAEWALERIESIT